MLPTSRFDVYDNAKATKQRDRMVSDIKIITLRNIKYVFLLLLILGCLAYFFQINAGDTASVRVKTIQVEEDDKARNQEEKNNEMFENKDVSQRELEETVENKGDDSDSLLWKERQHKVVEAYLHAYKGYKDYAWGLDELHPISKRGSDWFGLGLTIVDSLDLMILMGLEEQYQESIKWVKNHLSFRFHEANLFEVTIRVLGGLLSVYSMKKDPEILRIAKDLGDTLMSAFSSGSPIPFASVNLAERKGVPSNHGGDSSTAEVATIQLEFTYLSYLTGDHKYKTAADNVIKHIRSQPKTKGLVPIFINPYTGRFSGNTIRLGSRGDSYYEYLLKRWLQTSMKETWEREMYDEAVDGIKELLVKQSEPSKLTFIAELVGGSISPKMDHLVCFLPATLAVGATKGKTLRQAQSTMTTRDFEDLELAEKLTLTCYQMYAKMPTKLAPEIVYFNTNPSSGDDMNVHAADTHNLLRPETVESLFVLYRITENPIYREWGWEIFQAFERYTKIPSGGYSSITNVLSTEPSYRDKMESFFLAETLKYLFLLFGETTQVPLDKYVFNTEAHPLPIIEYE